VAEKRTAGTRPLLLAMALASGITSVPNAAVVVALPTIHSELHASLNDLEWTVTGFLLAYSAVMIAAGRLADVFGRVRVLVIGTVVYMAASVPAALADDATVLIGGLIVAGMGAAVLTPASLAIVTEEFRGKRGGMAVGVWAAASVVFSGIGPAIGGALTEQASWRWILWLNVIAGVVILIGVWRTPESRDEDATRNIDYTGLVLLTAGLSAIILALNKAPTPWPFSSAEFLFVLAGGVLMLVGFALLEPRLRDPLIDLSLFARRNLSGACIVAFVVSFPFSAVFFFLPLHLHEVLGYDALQSGLLLLPMTLTMMITMPLGGRWFDRIGPIPPILGGMVLTGVGMLLLGGISTSTGYAGLWPALALLGLGVGAALTPMNLVALNSVPRRNHGAVGGIICTVSGVGSTLGVALSGAVFEQLQTERTVSATADRGLHIGNAAAQTLEGLLAGAPDATRAIAAYPAGQQAALRQAVRDGFTSALGTTMLLSAAVVAVGAVLALLLIRPLPRPGPLRRPNVADPFSGLSPRP
jgi:EmrB/QacA subfamily drug resistance transporter